MNRLELAEVKMLHSNVVDEFVLGMIGRGDLRTLELDINLGADGFFIGHHDFYYQGNGQVHLGGMSIQEAMAVVLELGIVVKFDCKGRGAIPEVLRLATLMDPGKCMLHAFASEFDFHFEERKIRWKHENIPLAQVLKLREEAGNLPLQVGCRGFTFDGIRDRGSIQVADLLEVFRVAQKNSIEAIGLSLPDNQVPPDWVLQYFCDGGVLVEVYEAEIGNRELPCDVFTSVEVEDYRK